MRRQLAIDTAVALLPLCVGVFLLGVQSVLGRAEWGIVVIDTRNDDGRLLLTPEDADAFKAIVSEGVT